MVDPHPKALIVGASRGLGLGLAKELLGRGRHVIATVRSEAGRKALEPYAGPDGRCGIETIDVAAPGAAAALRARLEVKRLDFLMINAGVGPSPEMSFEANFNAMMAVNVLGALAVLNALEDLVMENGVIAVMSSGLGSIAANDQGGMEPYRSSKAALNQSLRSFVAERPDAKWSLTAIAPGWVRTDMGGPDAPLDVETSMRGVADVLDGRVGARGIAFLNYDGQTLPW